MYFVHRFVLLTTIGAICLLGAFPALAQKVFDAKTALLDNGLQIVVVENHRAPVATHMIWYKAGAIDELPQKSGIAHFLEHLMFKGHEYPELGSYAPGEFSRIVRSIGGEDNAFTGQDYTAYHQSVAVEHLEQMMRIEAARMRGLNVAPEEIASENKVICEERRQRIDNNPAAQLSEKMNAALFQNHPYGVPVIGWMEEMEKLGWEDAKAFYDKFYTPDNAILIVSGDVTLEKVVDMAKRTYGRLPRSAKSPSRTEKQIAKNAKKPENMLNDSQVITMRHKNIREAAFLRRYRVPGYRQNSEISLALEVLEEIMGAPSTGRLYKSIVVEQKLATNIGLYYLPGRWGDSIIGISATPASIDRIDELKAAIDKELQKIATEGPDESEVKSAVTRLIDSAVYARDSLSAPAMIIGSAMIVGIDLDDIENWPKMIGKVSAQDIKRAAQIYLNPNKPGQNAAVEGILLPENDNKNKAGEEK